MFDQPNPASTLQIRLFGELAVFDGERAVALPPSKKTRALLAYLVLTAREHRRTHLCDLLWDVADDPRGALRWSLSRLRRVVGPERIVATRETVQFVVRDVEIDRHELARVVVDAPHLTIDALERAVTAANGDFLDGLDLDDFDTYQTWCVAERGAARRLHTSVLRALTRRLDLDPERALPHLRELVRRDPNDEEAQVSLLRALASTDRPEELDQHVRLVRRRYAALEAPLPNWLDVTIASVCSPGLDADVERPAPAAEPAPLVARERERRELDEALRSTMRTRTAHAVVVSGEPGIGKSRLLGELPGLVARRGGRTLVTAAYEPERDRPYGPFLDLFGEDARLDERLVQLAVGPPLVLVIDDVQWIDEASAGLVHYLVRRLRSAPFLVALAVREGELGENGAATRLLRSLRRDLFVAELVPQPLTLPGVEALVATIETDCDPIAVHARSAGNPRYAIELARGVGDELPDRLRALVRARVDALPETARVVLQWGAVLGRAFGLSRLARLSGLEPHVLASALEVLDRRCLVEAAGEGRDSLATFAFRHEVVHRVVYDDLSTARRRLMSRQVARALQDSGACR